MHAHRREMKELLRVLDIYITAGHNGPNILLIPLRLASTSYTKVSRMMLGSTTGLLLLATAEKESRRVFLFS